MPVLNEKLFKKMMTRWMLAQNYPHDVAFSLYIEPPKPLPESARAQPLTPEAEDAYGTIDLSRGAVRKNGKPRMVEVRLSPGEEIELPSEYDNAIQTIDETGLICGGLAPMLTKVGGPERLVQKSLMPSAEAEVPRGVSAAELAERVAAVEKANDAAAEKLAAKIRTRKEEPS